MESAFTYNPGSTDKWIITWKACTSARTASRRLCCSSCRWTRRSCRWRSLKETIIIDRLTMPEGEQWIWIINSFRNFYLVLENSFLERKDLLGLGSGQVVSVLAFYFDNLSSKSHWSLHFFCIKIVFEMNENKQKEAWGWPVFLKKDKLCFYSLCWRLTCLFFTQFSCTCLLTKSCLRSCCLHLPKCSPYFGTFLWYLANFHRSKWPKINNLV